MGKEMEEKGNRPREGEKKTEKQSLTFFFLLFLLLRSTSTTTSTSNLPTIQHPGHRRGVLVRVEDRQADVVQEAGPPAERGRAVRRVRRRAVRVVLRRRGRREGRVAFGVQCLKKEGQKGERERDRERARLFSLPFSV